MSFIEELKRRHVIRVALAYLAGAWLLVQVLETLFPIFDLSEALLRLIVICIAVGFIPALVLSWAFEWTPQGIKPDSAVEPGSGQRVRTTRTLDRIIIVVLTVAVLFFAIDEFVFDTPGMSENWAARAERTKAFSASLEKDDISIAVLPFDSLATSSENEHFAHGLTEELLASLAAIPELRVSSRTSVFAIGGRNLAASEAADILGVRHILEGSVRRAGNNLRITTNLIDTSNDSQVWTGTYNRELTVDEIFDIQSEIAVSVINALTDQLLAPAAIPRPRGPTSLAALDHYHEGLGLLRQVGPLTDGRNRNFKRASASFEKAIELDDSWAPPHAMLGMLYHFARDLGGDEDEWLRLSRQHVTRALELDPSFGPAHSSMAYLNTIAGDYAQAMEQYDLAISLGENMAHWGKALLLRVLGRHDEAIDEFLAAAAVDPLDEVGRFQLFETYYCAERYADAIDGLTRFTVIAEEDMHARILLAQVHAQLGENDTAINQAERAIQRIGREAPLATVFALAGDNERARAALDSSEHNPPFIAIDVAQAAVLLGEPDKALDMLERAARQVQSDMGRGELYSWLFRLQCLPVIRQLEDEPRYRALLESLGLPT